MACQADTPAPRAAAAGFLPCSSLSPNRPTPSSPAWSIAGRADHQRCLARRPPAGCRGPYAYAASNLRVDAGIVKPRNACQHPRYASARFTHRAHDVTGPRPAGVIPSHVARCSARGASRATPEPSGCPPGPIIARWPLRRLVPRDSHEAHDAERRKFRRITSSPTVDSPQARRPRRHQTMLNDWYAVRWLRLEAQASRSPCCRLGSALGEHCHTASSTPCCPPLPVEHPESRSTPSPAAARRPIRDKLVPDYLDPKRRTPFTDMLGYSLMSRRSTRRRARL